MRFSVTLGAVGERTPGVLGRLAALAEESGWDAVFLEDYLDYQGTGAPTWDAWVCLSAIACATSRIVLGPTVTPVPRRRPWELAAQAAAVDQLSGGRLVLGAGAGDRADPALALLAAGGTGLDAGLEALDRLWAGDEVDGLRLPGRPVRRPRVPVWIGGDLRRPAVRRRLTRWDGACVHRERPLDPDDVHDILALVTAARGDARGFDVKVSGNPHLIAEFAAAGATWWGRWIPPGDVAEAEAVIAAGPPR
ncbi:LLM class flavin-dependent oxidoreductase [Catenuloplanes atrovinosus]|uniref:Alkanesulfonate monooxygenase SsuD/methylene tetrahydromethanopterin reductase-like flavin-dependent oxidoreductase (Luciferase family) n=1 Tax=Catenuloplanes atrovinosus TaxID=137266 RepID=A0AAE4C9R4_9ACTN|nr:LLM class flavin-dependent oxidoreductase [Catenuloplanes atrovinosus]MDR7276102.1 alkanesulfonate monooxygenase SsuD/methylene tetrahydromethanopterin reductase-like flavin-dependent oxidoreductase (luciferase family) [Catenuloplanes atrovinosus]